LHWHNNEAEMDFIRMRNFLIALLLVIVLFAVQASFFAQSTDGVQAADLQGTWKYRYLIESVAAKYDLPAGMIQAIMSVESGGNPNAYSSAGAIGLMQVMPGWFSWNENPWDWYTNIDKAGYILQQCKLSTGRWWQAGDDWVETISCFYYGHPVYYDTWYSNLVRGEWYQIAEQGG
jgi:soluble lytic murein transglycosylase-like protein